MLHFNASWEKLECDTQESAIPEIVLRIPQAKE
jgi:hypothetical protein